MQLYAELHRNILDLFTGTGVQIMTPAYEGDPKSRKWCRARLVRGACSDPNSQLPTPNAQIRDR